MDAIRPRSYVAAPVLAGGRTIGILQADRLHGDVDDGDLDTLATFALALGYVAERTILMEQLSSRQATFREIMHAAGELMNDVAGSSAELVRGPAHRPAPAGAVNPSALAGRADYSVGLTPRELEVVAMLAAGATNREIAGRLFIGASTVKSHVESALRKLGAANRAEAASIYAQLNHAS
jgi:DNA-binding CsgD family transcriptional regulator